VPIAADLGGVGNRSCQDKVEGRERVEGFIESQRGKSVMIFTDGSVNDEYSGVGSCAALLIPLESCETEVNQSEVFSVLADSTEAEVCGCGIGLASDMAIQYFCTRQEIDRTETNCSYCQTVKPRSISYSTDIMPTVMFIFCLAFDLILQH